MSVSHRKSGYMVNSVATSFVLALLLSSVISVSAQTCYGNDGKVIDDSFMPCDASQSDSACCRLAKTDGDICLTSGLCYAQVDDYNGFFYSNGCTDQSGQSDNCFSKCPNCKFYLFYFPFFF